MSNCTGIWNQLTKIHPPSFLTLNTLVSSKKKVLKQWSPEAELKYEENSELLNREFKILEGFIERKGTQLRLEKAQLITNQIYKTAQRWINNDFICNFSNYNFAIKGDKDESPRLPTLQWNSWIKYLALRETALLAKIKQECENATKFWLGLISSSFHWGDSLVIIGALSRIWYLSSVMLENLVYSIYPSLILLDSILEPNNSKKWPSNNCDFPSNLESFLISIKMPFTQTQLRYNFNLDESIESKGLLKETYKKSKNNRKSTTPHTKYEKTKKFKSPKMEAIPYRMNDSEDLGVIVQPKKKKGKKGPNKEAPAPPTVVIKTPDPKRSHLEELLFNYKGKMKTMKGRKKLIVKIRNCLSAESDSKVKLKLKRLRKSIKESSNEDLKAMPEIIKFETFIKKRLKKKV